MAILKRRKTMNNEEYTEHINAMRAFYEREEIDELVDIDAEPYFSWSSCDCCQSSLGGDRYEVAGFRLNKREKHEYSICVDCYLAVNGVLEVE
jgi:hypothetical protein